MSPFRAISTKSEFGVILRVYGILTTIFGAGACVVALTAHAGARGIQNWSFLLICGIAISFIGIGSAVLLRACVFAMSILAGISGLLLIVGSLIQVPFPWMLLNIFAGVLAVLPLFSVVCIWNDVTKEK